MPLLVFCLFALTFACKKSTKKILPPHSKRGDEHSQNIPSTRGIGTNSPHSSLQVEMLHTTVRVKRDKYTISARISLTTINNDMKLILVMHRTGVKYPLTNVVDAVQRASSPSPSHCIHLIRRVRDRRICGPCVMLFALLIALALCHRRFALAVVLMCRRVLCSLKALQQELDCRVWSTKSRAVCHCGGRSLSHFFH